ncbi:MAG TPA: ABC transporter permease [Vicinamibacteria bacterium]
MPFRRVLRAYAKEAQYESLRMLRAPAFAIPFLLLPVPIYLFFGVVMAGPAIAQRPGLGNYLFSGWLVFAVMGPALFGVGCALAIEREAGLLKLKRALPAPGGAYLLAKVFMAMVFGALSVLSLIVAALLAGKISLSPLQLLVMTAVMVAGALPLAAIGLFIGAHAPGSAAPALINVVFLPMLWLSGLFMPLPKFLEPWVVVWPVFHLNQAALGAAGVSEFRFMAPLISAAVLVGVTALFGGLAIRRLARVG